MSPGQTDFEGAVSFVTYHLLLGESIPEVEVRFDTRFGYDPPWPWGDVLAAATRGIAQAEAAYTAPMETTAGQIVGLQSGQDATVVVWFRYHFMQHSGVERWGTASIVVSSRQELSEIWAQVTLDAIELAQGSDGDLIETEILPPFDVESTYGETGPGHEIF